ncbi:MAG: hypothetical protein JW888_18625, partial [Pirellulales bacterium]|nr:hypothetical protein [Pirellulales bacterium]
MKHWLVVLLVVAVAWCCSGVLERGHAAIVGTGELVPGDPTTWGEALDSYVGHQTIGALTVDGGSNLLSQNSWIGCFEDAAGDVTITGTGSTWNSSGNLNVGLYGDASLAISAGAAVTVGETTRVTCFPGSSGTIELNTGGTLATRTLAATPSRLLGTGTISTRGLVSDLDVVFDSPTSLHQTLAVTGEPGQNVTIDLDMTDPASNGWFGAGFEKSGTVTIRNGVTVSSMEQAYLGYREEATGVVNVDGTDSTWASTGDMTIGYYGQATLNVLNGGAVTSNGVCNVGYQVGADGQVNVDGAGSRWTGATQLVVGRHGDGTVNITNGGQLSVTSSTNVGLGGGSGTLVVSGPGSSWSGPTAIYFGTFANSKGTLRVLDGGTVTNSDCTLAVSAGTTTMATVSGAGSTWTNNGTLHVGRDGTGSLTIDDGGTVSNATGTMGYYATGVGHALVCGMGSTWANSTSLSVGNAGKATLVIADGGAVSSPTVSIGNSQSLLSIEVGSNSRLTVGGGTGALANNGTVRFIA